MTLSTTDRVAGAIFVVAGILFQSLLLGLPAALLSVTLVIMCVVWTTGSWSVSRSRFGQIFAIGIVVFIAHAAEEYMTGLARRLRALVGREPGATRSS